MVRLPVLLVLPIMSLLETTAVNCVIPGSCRLVAACTELVADIVPPTVNAVKLLIKKPLASKLPEKLPAKVAAPPVMPVN